MARRIAIIGNIAGGATTANTALCHVIINGIEVALAGAVVPPHPDTHPVSSMQGTSHVKINGVKVVGNSDLATCGHAITATGFAKITP